MVKTDIQSVKLRFGIIGNTEALNRAIDIAIQVAPTDLAVLVTGESGVGKESFPQIVHQFSRRKHGPYIAVNCGAIPEGTIDSELFGHEKGAFTGAISDRNGYFAEANGGTVFLDEVGELPLSTQARLLRVLESGEFIKVGSSKVQKTDVRIVAATNVDFDKAIAEGRFREDLYYRLNTVPVKVPPLRERANDIVLLFKKFASDFAEKYRMPAVQLDEEAKRMLMAYEWPGNIRQLKNITEQISIIETNREISSTILQNYLPSRQIVHFPAVAAMKTNTGGLANEREMIYQMIFDMRREVSELKSLVHELMSGHAEQTALPHQQDGRRHTVQNMLPLLPEHSQVSSVLPTLATAVSPFSATHISSAEASEVLDTEEYIEENLSLDEVEKEMIRKALEKHHGRRKSAASDLKISERTLYRKIKEYGLD